MQGCGVGECLRAHSRQKTATRAMKGLSSRYRKSLSFRGEATALGDTISAGLLPSLSQDKGGLMEICGTCSLPRLTNRNRYLAA